MTAVPRPDLYPNGATPPLLLGYHAEEDVFAAWDATKHRQTRDPRASGGSNSLYVPLTTLVEARRLGFASHERVVANDVHEIVVAFRPEAADHYLRLAPALRARGSANVHATASAAGGGIIKKAGLTQRRVAVLRQVRQTVRDARFPGEVLSAYGEQCAFCGLGARLIDAAHIKSVREHGPDHVTNGVALCPTHHRAFDRGLVVIEDDYALVVNPSRTGLLKTAEIKKLGGTLRRKLALPPDPQLRPDLRFVKFHRRKAATV
jgi:putative restriction endonuclease